MPCCQRWTEARSSSVSLARGPEELIIQRIQGHLPHLTGTSSQKWLEDLAEKG